MPARADALEQAIHNRRPVHRGGLIHHSDRGSQYVSIKYTERLAEAGIEPSVGSGPDDECPAVRQLAVCHLKLGPLAGNDRPVLASVELERLARREHQRHEGTATAGLEITLAVGLPGSHERGHPIVGSVIAQHHQIGVHLLRGGPLFARPASLDPQPGRQLLGEGSSLLGRSGTLNLGSTVSARRYLRIVLRDNPVRRPISRIGIPSRKRPAPDYAQ